MALPARRQEMKRDLPVFRDDATARTANLPDVAVNFGQLSRPCGPVQAVHVLRDQPEVLIASFQLDDSLMGRVGSFCGDEFTPPAIPFPDYTWVTRKRLRGRQIFCAVVAP